MPFLRICSTLQTRRISRTRSGRPSDHASWNQLVSGVLVGFGVITVIILVGFGLGRGGVLGPEARPVLSKLIFYVAQPCLLFSLIVKTQPQDLLTPALGVQMISVAAAIVTYLAVVVPIWRPKGGETVIGVMSASYVNIGNLGIPIAVYALGDSSQIAPIMLFQMALYTPIAMICLDVVTGGGDGLWPTLKHVLLNPVLIASVVAIAVVTIGIPVPDVIYEPVHLIAGISVPTMLINFGMSLAAKRPFSAGSPIGRITVAVLVKSFVQPAIGWVLAVHLFGLSGHALMVAVVMAALPTAQNTYNYATTYGVGQTLARDTAFTSTLISVPVVAGIVALLY
ncbi:AEC family transporter [Pseudoclavibacter sp. CFCC 14310]|nr:AEC family transporter [Pseudoclavibacter sp. CFCC 14310]